MLDLNLIYIFNGILISQMNALITFLCIDVPLFIFVHHTPSFHSLLYPEDDLNQKNNTVNYQYKSRKNTNSVSLP
jgi:hypothetical protein